MFTVVRRASQSKSGPRVPTLSDWDPIHLMQNLLREDAYGERTQAHRPSEPKYFPRFDVKETNDAFLFHADVPGVREQDIDIQVTGNRLVITGKRAAESRKEGENYHLTERGYGEFSRSFTLPESADTDRITASTTNGVLGLILPKRTEAQPRRVTINKSPAATAPVSAPVEKTAEKTAQS